MQTCKDCKFYSPLAGNRNGKRVGICEWLPPPAIPYNPDRENNTVGEDFKCSCLTLKSTTPNPPLESIIRPRIILESPYRGESESTHFRNKRYAISALRDSLSRGEAPIASHILFAMSAALDEYNPREREVGIFAGLAWIAVADAMVLYTDYGISKGMFEAQIYALKLKIPVIERSLYQKGN